jgi:hypothetical protein
MAVTPQFFCLAALSSTPLFHISEAPFQKASSIVSSLIVRAFDSPVSPPFAHSMFWFSRDSPPIADPQHPDLIDQISCLLVVIERSDSETDLPGQSATFIRLLDYFLNTESDFKIIQPHISRWLGQFLNLDSLRSAAPPSFWPDLLRLLLHCQNVFSQFAASFTLPARTIIPLIPSFSGFPDLSSQLFLPLFRDQAFLREFVIGGGPERLLEIVAESSGDRRAIASLFIENFRTLPSEIGWFASFSRRFAAIEAASLSGDLERIRPVVNFFNLCFQTVSKSYPAVSQVACETGALAAFCRLVAVLPEIEFATVIGRYVSRMNLNLVFLGCLRRICYAI